MVEGETQCRLCESKWWEKQSELAYIRIDSDLVAIIQADF